MIERVCTGCNAKFDQDTMVESVDGEYYCEGCAEAGDWADGWDESDDDVILPVLDFGTTIL